MNVNLDIHILRKYKFGRLIDQLYKFDTRWHSPETINQPYEPNKADVAIAKRAIKKNQRIDAPVILEDIGIVAGIHTLEAFKELRIKRIPVLHGFLPKEK
jgi:hypothetical protein